MEPFWKPYINLACQFAAATGMERAIAQQEPMQATSPVRRPKFPGESLIERPEGAQRRGRGSFSGLLESSSKFVDPRKEASLILPEQLSSSLISIESQLAPKYSEATLAVQKSVLVSAYEYLLSLMELFRKGLRHAGKRRTRLTRKGEEALSQLQYLSALCDATSCRTPDEIIAAESAFGESYYEIMKLSAELEKMSQAEQHHHMSRYTHHISRFLSSAEV